MGPVPVTLLYGGLNALLNVGLGLNISLRRLFKKTYSTAELPPDMKRANRAHGNNAEWLPLGLVLLLLVELSGAPSLPLHLFGGGVLLARTCHATGMLTGTRLQLVGAVLNYTVMGLLAGYTLLVRFRLM